MVIWIAFAVAWAWLLYSIRQGGLRRTMLVAGLCAATAAFGVDAFAGRILGLYEVQLAGLSFEWSVLILGLLGFPAIGALFVRYLPAKDLYRVIYAVVWTAALTVVEQLAVAQGEVVYTGWEAWWSPLVYLGGLILAGLTRVGEAPTSVRTEAATGDGQ